MTGDVEAVEKFVSDLTQGLPEGFYYHNWEHTLDVVEQAVLYAQEQRLPGDAILLLRTAALLHDSGFSRDYDGHEKASADIAKEVLPGFGYTQGDIESIVKMILATRWPQSPHTPLEETLCDADMDNLGRDDFFEKSADLRRELHAVCSLEYTDPQWHRVMFEMLESHSYFTLSARQRRDTGKIDNIQRWIKSLQVM